MTPDALGELIAPRDIRTVISQKSEREVASAHPPSAPARIRQFRPTDVRNRVQVLVDRIVANRVRVTAEVTALVGASAGYVAQTAENVERNALRIAGRLS